MIVDVDADTVRSKVACCQHGRLLLRHWRLGGHGVSIGFRGLVLDDPVHQYLGNHTRLLLLHFRTKVRVAPDGSVEVLLRILCGQDQ